MRTVKLSDTLCRRLRFGRRVIVPRSLNTKFKEAGLHDVVRIDTRPNGYCGWYMLALFSQLRQRYRRVHAGAVQDQMRRLIKSNTQIKPTEAQMSHLLTALEAGMYCDALGYNLIIWRKQHFRRRSRVSWSYDITSYREGRPWLMAYNNTDKQVHHWECFARKVSGGKTLKVDLVFRDLPAALLDTLPDKDIDTRPLVADSWKHDILVNWEDYMVVLEDYESSTSEDEPEEHAPCKLKLVV